MKTRMLFLAVWCVVLLNASICPAYGKMRVYTIAEFVEMSDTIIVGKVAKLDESSASVDVLRQLRGKSTGKRIVITPAKMRTCTHFVSIAESKDYVFFLQRKPDSAAYTVVADGWGRMELRQDTESVVKRILQISSLPDDAAKMRAMIAEAWSDSDKMSSEACTYILRNPDQVAALADRESLLSKMLGSGRVHLQRTALNVLQRLDAPGLVPKMIALTRSQDRFVIEAASIALVRYDTAKTVAAIAALSYHDDAHVRSRAAVDLGRSRRQEAREVLLKLCDDSEPRVRENAAGAFVWRLREKSNDRVIQKLKAMLDDVDEAVQAAAAYALGESRSASAAEALINKLRASDLSEKLESRAMQSLSKLYSAGPRPAAEPIIDVELDVIIAALDGGRRSPGLEAVNILRGAGTQEARDALRKAAESHPEPDVMRSAKSALTELAEIAAKEAELRRQRSLSPDAAAREAELRWQESMSHE